MLVIFAGVVITIRIACGIAGDTLGLGWRTLLGCLIFNVLEHVYCCRSRLGHSARPTS